MALAGTLLATASPAVADEPSQTGPYLIGDPAGEQFAFVGIFFLDNRVLMRSPVEPSHPYYLGQQWYIRDAGSGQVNIVNAREPFPNAELCMLPATNPGATHYVHGGLCSGAPWEFWTIEPVNGGARVISELTGTCLTLPSSPWDNLLRMEPCGGSDQVFVFSPVE